MSYPLAPFSITSQTFGPAALQWLNCPDSEFRKQREGRAVFPGSRCLRNGHVPELPHDHLPGYFGFIPVVKTDAHLSVVCCSIGVVVADWPRLSFVDIV